MTRGIWVALIVPNSGTVTWKSERISSRKASNSGSDLSTSSISNRVGSADVMALRSGRGTMKLSEKKTESSRPTRSAASRTVFAPAMTWEKRSFKIWV